MESLSCPVSSITPDSLFLINRFYEQQRAHKATGGVLYGIDMRYWPTRWADAVNVIQHEIERADGSYERAKAAYINSQRM